MPATITTSTATRRTAPKVTVWTRAAWWNGWTARPGLWCRSCEFAVSPTMPEAVLAWRYGVGSLPGEYARATHAPLQISGHYVRILIDPDADADVNDIPAWYGKVVDVVDRRDGATSAATRVPAGEQTFVCWGLECELDQAPIVSSWIDDGDGGKRQIGRAIGFNLGAGRECDHGQGGTYNRSGVEGPDDVYLFAEDPVNAPSWSVQDIVDYLLKYHVGRELTGARVMDWSCFPSDSLDWEPKLQVEGATVKQVLDTLLDRRRGLGWYVRCGGAFGSEEPVVVPFTHTDADVELPRWGKIAANAQQVALDFDMALDIQHCEVRQTEVGRYDQVVARGAEIGAIFTINTKLGRLVKDWSGSEQTRYNDPSAVMDNFGSLQYWERQIAIDNYRENESGCAGEGVTKVYSWFKLLDDWTGYVPDVTDAEANAVPAMLGQSGSFFDDQHSIDFSVPVEFWRPGLRFERSLPVYLGIDYSSNQIVSYNSGLRPATSREPVAPMVFIKLESNANYSWVRYQAIDKLAASASEGVDVNGRNWACAVKMRDDKPGLILKVSGRAAQHKLAATDFEACCTADDIPADLDWRDDIVATVYCPTDTHCEARWPADGDVSGGSGVPLRRMYLSFPEAHLDYVVPKTVVGVKDFQLTTSDGGVVRNDLDILLLAAKAAWLWYGQPRAQLLLQYRQLRRTVDVGDLITQIGSGATAQAIRTCVSRVRYDIDAGQTTVQTQYGELDLKGM